MADQETARVVARRAVTAAVVALVAAWCVPVLASSGIEILGSDTRPALGKTAPSANVSRAAHTESALKDMLDDETMAVPALAEATAESVEVADETETQEKPVDANVRTPAVTTRLPGVSETTLPSFRRQMHRTDI